MADERSESPEIDAYTASCLRIFGSVEAWDASLPPRMWFQGDAGWVSQDRPLPRQRLR
jgi:hypothetical protein